MATLESQQYASDSFERGRTHFRAGEFEEAAEAFRISYEIEEEVALAYLERGVDPYFEMRVEDPDYITQVLEGLCIVGDFEFSDRIIAFLCTNQSRVGPYEEHLALSLFDADNEDATMEQNLARILLELVLSHKELEGSHSMPFEACLLCLRTSVRLNPTGRAIHELGQHCWSGGRAAEAVAAYRHLEHSFRDEFDEDSALIFGWSLQGIGLVREAEHWLRKAALDYAPRDFGIVEALLDFYGQQQRWVDAKEIAEAHLRLILFDDAITVWEEERCWAIHARCCELIGDVAKAERSLQKARMREEQRLRKEIADGREVFYFELGMLLATMGRIEESEMSFATLEEIARSKIEDGLNSHQEWGHRALGRIYEARGEMGLAEFHLREALRRSGDSYGSVHLPLGRVLLALQRFRRSEQHLRVELTRYETADAQYWLGKCLLAQGRMAEAESFLISASAQEPFDAIYSETLAACQRGLATTGDVSVARDFSSWLSMGNFWLESASWQVPRSPLLSRLFNDGAEWADPRFVLFDDFEVSEDDLDDTLARVEEVSRQVQFAPEMPVKLKAKNMEVVLDVEGQVLRGWVAIDGVGVAVSVNLNTWDLCYAEGDRDAMFAAGVVINWFIDCSIALKSHPKFGQIVRQTSKLSEVDLARNEWFTFPAFHSDIEEIRAGRMSAPPKAHRVRGHIRRLGDGLPSDGARHNAPPYIRRHMAADETWVRSHSRGGDASGENLVTRLRTYSSLADFLATTHTA